ncbi:MAG: hypothetical protein BJ554DRAFT_2878, partial [Olpidium bornovanus]
MPRPRKAGARWENHLLPDDLRFSSEQLLSMFTREGSVVRDFAAFTVSCRRGLGIEGKEINRSNCCRFHTTQLSAMQQHDRSPTRRFGSTDDVRGDHLENEAQNDDGDLGPDISTFYDEEDSDLAQDGTFGAGSSVQGLSTIEEEVVDGGHGGDSLEMDYGSQSAAAWPVSRQQRPAERIKFDRQAKR